MKRNPGHILLFAGGLALALGVAGCHRHKHAKLDPAESAEPDKILYEKAVEDIGNKRYDVARITLQTLINTYPDSDYLADSKIAIADSYYDEGTSSALIHAEVEYKDYITFFPNSPKVPYAQYRAAMCHFQRLEKPDRDRTHARRAEDEFRLLLINYPDSEYADEGEIRLIQVQEVLGEGEFRVGRFYFIKGSLLAAHARLANLAERYPNYSKRDAALWMLARIFHKEIPPYWTGDPDQAAEYYARIIREHPLSKYVKDAKAELAALGRPLPEADPELLARAQTVKPIGEKLEGEKQGLLGRLFGILSSRPDTSEAAPRLGPPPLESPPEEVKLPPTVFAQKGESSVSVQTVEDLPAGTVIQAGVAETPKDGAPANQAGKQAGKNQKPPKRKKSFWRKLIPFY